MKKVLCLLPALLFSELSNAYNPNDWSVMGYQNTQFSGNTTWTGANFNGVNLTLTAQLGSSGGLMTEYAWGTSTCGGSGGTRGSTNSQYIIVPNTVDYIDPQTNQRYQFELYLPSGQTLNTADFPNSQYAKISTSTNVGGASCNSTPYRPQAFGGSIPITLISRTNLPIRNAPHVIDAYTTLFGVRNPDWAGTNVWMPQLGKISPKNSSRLTFYVTVTNTCSVNTNELNFNFGALPMSVADTASKSLSMNVSCVSPGNIKVTYQPSNAYDAANPTRTDLGLGWYGELAMNGSKRTTMTFNNMTSQNVQIDVNLGKKIANPSAGNINGGGVLIFEYI